MIHHATKNFWTAYEKLPPRVRAVADKNFKLLKTDTFHPSLHFKKTGVYWSVRAGIEYRALGTWHHEKNVMIWFWIGHHSEYDRLIG